jgi:hypothetical protein
LLCSSCGVSRKRKLFWLDGGRAAGTATLARGSAAANGVAVVAGAVRCRFATALVHGVFPVVVLEPVPGVVALQPPFAAASFIAACKCLCFSHLRAAALRRAQEHPQYLPDPYVPSCSTLHPSQKRGEELGIPAGGGFPSLEGTGTGGEVCSTTATVKGSTSRSANEPEAAADADGLASSDVWKRPGRGQGPGADGCPDAGARAEERAEEAGTGTSADAGAITGAGADADADATAGADATASVAVGASAGVGAGAGAGADANKAASTGADTGTGIDPGAVADADAGADAGAEADIGDCASVDAGSSAGSMADAGTRVGAVAGDGTGAGTRTLTCGVSTSDGCVKVETGCVAGS